MPTVILNEENHEYRVDGTVKPSVSDVLAGVGVRSKDGHWRSISGAEFMAGYEAPRAFGSAFHGYPKLRLTGHAQADIDYDPAMEPWVSQWESWYSEHINAETILHNSRPLVERPLYSRFLDFCGTPDWAIIWNGKPVVVDWKTGAHAESQRYQVAAYTRMLEDNLGIKGWSAWIVPLTGKENEKPIVDVLKPAEVRIYQNRFMSILNVYKLGGKHV